MRAQVRRELMLVGVGRMGRPYVEAARRLGLGLHAVEAASRVAAVADDADSVHACRGEPDELWVEAASAAVLTTGPPDGIVAFSEPQVMAAALLQDGLGLQGPSLHAAVLSRNKALQRAKFAAAGVRQPEYLVTEDVMAGADWAAERFPVVLKPLSCSGSEGVELIADMDGFRAAGARRAGEGRLLIETAVDGPEYSWEALVVDGDVWFSNVTAKETTGPPNFIEVAHRTAAELPARAAAQLDALAAGVLAGLRMRTGMVHLEFRLSDAGPTLMEVAVRTPGDFLMDLLGLTYGVDWFELAVRAALSLPLPDPPSAPVRYAASYFPVVAPGTVARIGGLDEITAHPCVVDRRLRVAEGTVVAPVKSSAQRAGYVVLAAAAPAELEDGLAFVRGTLEIDTV